METSKKAMDQPPELTHRTLEIFAAVINHAGISSAARALDISQPSVSRHVAELEQLTGLKLFIKRGRAIVPTMQAIALFEQVERSFISLRDIALHAQQLRHEQLEALAVGSLPALGHSGMPAAIAALRIDMPGTRVQLQIDSSPAIARMVASMQIDLGFVAASVYPTGVERIARLSGACHCILPAGHVLKKATEITVRELVGYPFVALSAGSRIRQKIEAAVRQADSALSVVAETKQSTSASELVLRGVGISVVDPFAANEHVRRGGLAVPFRPLIEYGIDVIAHADSRPGEAARALIGQIRQIVRDTSDLEGSAPRDTSTNK